MVRVSYSTEFGDYEKVIALNDIVNFSKDYTITSVEEIVEEKKEYQVITRQMAKDMAMSRDCSCVLGKDRDSNFDQVIDKVYDYFEQYERNKKLEEILSK
jgi:hypothetical protein